MTRVLTVLCWHSCLPPLSWLGGRGGRRCSGPLCHSLGHRRGAQWEDVAPMGVLSLPRQWWHRALPSPQQCPQSLCLLSLRCHLHPRLVACLLLTRGAWEAGSKSCFPGPQKPSQPLCCNTLQSLSIVQRNKPCAQHDCHLQRSWQHHGACLKSLVTQVSLAVSPFPPPLLMAIAQLPLFGRKVLQHTQHAKSSRTCGVDG